jgi:hypothetical protein
MPTTLLRGSPLVFAFDRRRLREVERLALRDAVDDVEQHDFAELSDSGKMGQGAADLARADQGNTITRHEIPFRLAARRSLSRAEHQREGWLNAIRPSRKVLAVHGPLGLDRLSFKPKGLCGGGEGQNGETSTGGRRHSDCALAARGLGGAL